MTSPPKVTCARAPSPPSPAQPTPAYPPEDRLFTSTIWVGLAPPPESKPPTGEEDRLFKSDADWAALLSKWRALGQGWPWQRPISQLRRGWAMDRLRGERGAARARYAAQQLELAQRTHPRVITLAEQV